MLIDTGDKTLSGSSQLFTLTCSSDTSIQPGGFQTKTIQVDFVDECLQGQLSQPQIDPSYYEMQLYTSSSANFNQVTVTPNCPYTYQLIPLQENSPLALNQALWTVDASPSSVTEHTGLFEYII